VPTTEDVRRALTLATSPDALDFFYESLTSPDWIPPLRESGVLADPPQPIEQGGGIAFPGWGLSRYLVRVAPLDPQLVAGALADIETSTNPRIQHDIVDALIEMPADYAVRFVPAISRWIHHPYRLGLARSAAVLGAHLIAARARQAALDLLRSMAMLVPPETAPADPPWAPLDDYDYRELVPQLARSAAAFGIEGPNLLAEELERHLEAEYQSAQGEPPRDLSFIWRPAIEDHEQNQDFDPQAHLLGAVRDAFVSAIDLDRSLLGPSVRDLVARRWASLQRVGLYLLNRYGDDHIGLIAETLTNPDLFGDVDVHHEFFGLAATFFDRIPAESQTRYVELVDEIAERETADDEPEVGERRRNWWARNRLGAVVGNLSNGPRDRYERLTAEFGPEEHPDFLSYHTSWIGPTSPLSEVDVRALEPEELVATLAGWDADQTDDRRPSPEGLARVVTEVVQKDPAPYAATAPRYIALEPAYARGLLFGFRQALRADLAFDWQPVLVLCEAIVRQPVGEDESQVDRGRDPGWAWTRTEVAHLLETALEDRPNGIPIDESGTVWTVLRILAEDADPTPESEVRFGPPNMDPLTYSLNTTRGQAMHGVCGYATWVQRHAHDGMDWRLSAELPDVARLLETHLEPGADPSIAVRAVYGWWLAWLIYMDTPWVVRNLDRLLGDLSTPLELAVWETFLVHSGGHRDSYSVLSDYYHRYAGLLATLAEEPAGRISGVVPAERLIDHLFQLRDVIPPDAGPLEVMLDSGAPWLITEIVENSGRIVHRAPEILDDVAASLQSFWERIRRHSEERSDAEVSRALAPFGWWFASRLPVGWALPELLAVLATGAAIDPDFLVLERLGQVANEFPGEAFGALEQIVMREEEQGWPFRTHEDDIRPVLSAALTNGNPMLRTRAEALTHRLGRMGLQGLRGLLDL
jgi:hypothetical protein